MIIKKVCRVIVSALLAFGLLNVFSFFYSNVPPHCVNVHGTTDFCRPPHAFYSRWTEGGGFGFTNNEGLYNLYDYREGMPVDILVMGNSHTEGSYIPLQYSIASQLNERFPDKTAYNLGMAAHDFINCAQNMEAALDRYRPKYVCIITNYLILSEDLGRLALEGQLPDLVSFSTGVVNSIEHIPYARLLYDNWQISFQQYLNRNNLLRFVESANDKPDGDEVQPASAPDIALPPMTFEEKQELAEKLFKSYADTLAKYDAKMIIFYDPSTVVCEDGSLLLSSVPLEVEYFSYLCEKNGLLFIDMSERYLSEYNSKHILPHGFWNSSVGNGHLNRAGNTMIADEIYKKIKEVD